MLNISVHRDCTVSHAFHFLPLLAALAVVRPGLLLLGLSSGVFLRRRLADISQFPWPMDPSLNK